MNTKEVYLNMQEENRKIEKNLEGIKHKIVVFSGKGGVGKTMFSINLAYSIMKADNSIKVGLLDADITTPNIPKILNIDGELRAKDNKIVPYEYKGVEIASTAFMAKKNDAIIWRGPLRSKLINQFLSDVEWKANILIADLPPGTGDEVLTIVQSMKPDIAIVITTPQELSLLDARRSLVMAKKFVKNVLLVENMSYLKCPKCGEKIDIFGEGNSKKLADEQEVQFLGELPLDVNARRGTDKGKIAVIDLENSDFSKDFKPITERILKLLK